jgi:hypothetical protein
MKGFRSLLFSLAVAVVGVLQAADWATIVPADKAGLALTIVGVVSAVLRFFTSTPVFEPK